MKKKELLSIIQDNADVIRKKILSTSKGFVVYITPTGNISSKPIEGWESSEYSFGEMHLLMKSNLANHISKKLIIAQAKFDLYGDQDMLSPVEELREKIHYEGRGKISGSDFLKIKPL